MIRLVGSSESPGVRKIFTPTEAAKSGLKGAFSRALVRIERNARWH
jgi:hypothetical protein